MTVPAPLLHLYRQREVRAVLDVAAADILRGVPDGPDPTVVGPRSADDARWIYFTSGTTGRPRGVRHTDATLLAAARGFTAHLGLGSYPEEVGTIGFPVAHIGGTPYLASALIGAFPALLTWKIDAAELPGQLAENRVTISCSSTAFYQMLLAAQFASGGDQPLIPSLMKQKWPERLMVVDEFAMTGLRKVAKSERAEQVRGGGR
ncbi:hypothetical protein A5674_22695 [Mycobacterium malmoense]|nr:AMP-binding protein [Mycobacterium malmoense]OCB24367.1 hypothetical protein A5674_22695 [Mycobacterium malmoense]